jgi:diguanylate cyclase (GGDEF)-like protein/putative nucleotidyltransferase with HDIG domain
LLLFALGSFIAFTNFFPSQIRLWSSFFPLGGITALIAYCHFVGAFTHKNCRLAVFLGYGAVAVILIPLIIQGYIPKSAEWIGGGVLINYGPFIYLIIAIATPFVVLPIFLLVQRLRTLKDPLEQNRVKYLLVGIAVLTLFIIREVISTLPNFSLSQIGHLCNALVITCAILKYHLLDIKLIVKKGLIYSGIAICIASLYLIVLSGLQFSLNDWGIAINFVALIVISVLMAWLFNPILALLQKGVDRLFYGKCYEDRQMIVSFAKRMNKVLDLNELIEAMLQSITRAMHVSQASLLLYNGTDFSSRFTERLIDGEPIPMKLSIKSPIVTWLTRENKTLSRNLIDVSPDFKGLSETERNALSDQEIEAFYPLKNKGNLIGILALSKKHPYGFYSLDDINLLTTMVREVAVFVENAQLYAEAKQRANTDELTGLFNHRFFHQCLDEEIARCSRFGEIFGLLYIDLDLFKIYNDTQGHLEGDEILRIVSKDIKSSIRMIDTSFRYGGDEFAVILPYTQLDGAYKVGERIRKAIESTMDAKGAAITCSVGIASWPADGLMREDIIKTADAALYFAKQTGRNRTCLGSEVVLSELLKMEGKSKGEPAVLNTIYALAATVDAKDHHTYGHSKKVAKYAAEIAEVLGYSQERIATIRAAGLLHDIGKIGVSDQLLKKAGPLSIEDWELIRTHPDLGVAILKNVDRLRGCLGTVKYHHERYDGTGYPAGLKGDNIPLDARILSVADSYDSMTSSRPYREKATSPDEALEELKRCSGSQFDPNIVEIFTKILEKDSLEKTKVALT